MDNFQMFYCVLPLTMAHCGNTSLATRPFTEATVVITMHGATAVFRHMFAAATERQLSATDASTVIREEAQLEITHLDSHRYRLLDWSERSC